MARSQTKIKKGKVSGKLKLSLKPHEKLRIRKTVKKFINFYLQRLKRKEKKQEGDVTKINADMAILKKLSAEDIAQMATDLYFESKKPTFHDEIPRRDRELINLILQSNLLKKDIEEITNLQKKRKRKEDKRKKKERNKETVKAQQTKKKN